MKTEKILDDLANARNVNQKDYDMLLHTQQYKVIIRALNERLKINRNPKTLLEIFRLAEALTLYDVIVKYKDVLLQLKDVMKPSDFKIASQLIKKAQKKMSISSTRPNVLLRKQTFDHDHESRALFVHHDNEPFVDRKIEIPDDPDEFERMLFNASMENQNLYELLLRYRYRKD